MMKFGSPTSAVILAAGTSTRMGTVKQLLRLDDRPLLQHVMDNVRASAVTEIIVVLGCAADAIRREIDAQNVRMVINESYQQGMGTSLKAGLSAVNPQAEAAIVVLADQPFVRPATLDRLITEHHERKAQIVIPTYRGFRGNPVLLDRSVFPEIMTLNGDMGCRAIFGNHLEGIVKVPVDDVGTLLDIDRPSDFEALRQAGNRVERERTILETVELQGRSLADASTTQPEMIIVGRDEVAVALAKLGKLLRFTITVVDPLLATTEFPEADRMLRVLDFSMLAPNPDRHVLVASRGTCDEEAIEQALAVKSAYVALLANMKRGEEVLRSLRMKGIATEKLAQVRVPAGLKIGADTPEEIALSIMAEIVSERRKRAGGMSPAFAKDSRKGQPKD
jgi:molybdenum cofactor cytidylyltransferase